MSARAILGLPLLVACASPPELQAPAPSTGSLPVRHVADPARAARGEQLLTGHRLGRGVVPRLALRSLWVVWGDASPGTDTAYWDRFGDRYGLHEAPYPNDGYPMGLHAVDATTATFDCLLCHAGVVAGRTLLGVANTTLDLQGLNDDLVRLAEVAPRFGFPASPPPFRLEGRTGAAGANDAFGLGMEFASRYDPRGPGLNVRYGFQRPSPWYTQRFRDRAYTDGSGRVGGHRTMMATLLAFGLTLPELQSMDADFTDLQHYLVSLAPPRWDLTTLDPSARERGRGLFDAGCASCHGAHTGAGARFPDRVVPAAEVGTDPARAAQFTAREAAWVNATWFGADHPMTATGGYLAPPLAGVWATAPYFHNGSVPDLRGVLDSRQRPARWARVGSDADAYDPARVGWRYRIVEAPADPATIEGRRVYDTARAGLGNGGHRYGDALTDAQRDDLLEYLRSL